MQSLHQPKHPVEHPPYHYYRKIFDSTIECIVCFIHIVPDMIIYTVAISSAISAQITRLIVSRLPPPEFPPPPPLPLPPPPPGAPVIVLPSFGSFGLPACLRPQSDDLCPISQHQ